MAIVKITRLNGEVYYYLVQGARSAGEAMSMVQSKLDEQENGLGEGDTISVVKTSGILRK